MPSGHSQGGVDVQLYFAIEFADAAVRFKQILTLHPEEKTAQLCLERSAQRLGQGVPETWQGVETMESK